MEYVLISTGVAGIALFVAFFLRTTREAREEIHVAAANEGGLEDFWADGGRASSAALLGVFSSEDHQFIAGEGSQQVSALFRRERKRLALRWIERQKRVSAGIMRKHREASRSA